MENKSVQGAKFALDVANTEENKQTNVVNNSPVEGEETDEVSVSKDEKSDSAPKGDENEEYTDYRKVTICLVKNYSLYRKANDKALPRRKDYIGSSVDSSKQLASNKEEVEAYFPNIIGLSVNDPNFVMRTKQYLNNIRIPVDELNRSFDISFHYYKKKDYYKFKAEEDNIEAAFQSVNRQDIQRLKEAVKDKVKRLNELESRKHKYGYPINVEEYLMYRHCLLYNDVAKDVALINSDSSIRFYFKDDKKELEKLRKHRLEVNRAKSNYVACLADDTLFDAVYIQYCSINSLPIIFSLAEDRLEREIKLDKFSTDEPVKFNKIYNNKDVRLIATIEMLIARGELVRSQYNQNITTQDGEFIGANMIDAIAWFKNPENSSYVAAFNNKLKNM